MVQYQQRLDRTFAALADPTRRDILERLGRGNATITELAEPFEMSLTGLKKHVQVLEEAELVTHREGRADAPLSASGPRRSGGRSGVVRQYRQMLDARLDRLGELLESTKGEREQP